MSFDELKRLLVEWYELGKEINIDSMDGIDAFMDVQERLREYARTLYEGRGEPEEIVKTAEVTE